METSSKNSLEQYSFEIQEIKETTKKIDLSIEKDRNKEVIKDVRYIPYYDLILNSTPVDYVQEEIFNEKTQVILPEQELVRNHHDVDHSNCRVELNNSNFKMALRQQHREMAECGKSNVQSNVKDYESMEILQKLPPYTIVIKQEGKANRQDNDYKKLIETNSNDNSSTSNCSIAKLNISRAVRNKTHEIIGIKQNPLRGSKKKTDKDFPRSKRLLTNSKRQACLDYKSNKYMKLSTMPYMNTRSVTRKMYTVGATYQPPTKRDETEWKEWPVHGMHERPIYHLQAGLAVEYLGKYFTSLDGLSYCEIIDEPDIEVVAVDPHYDQQVSLIEKKLKKRTKLKCPLNIKDTLNTLSVKDKSFEMCMHTSLHCVLGYCSELMTPAYRQAVQNKIMKLTVPVAKAHSLQLTKEVTNNKNNTTSSLENIDKFAEKANLLEAYVMPITQNIQNKNTTNNIDSRRVIATFPSSSVHIPKVLRSTEINRSKITPQSKEMIKMNLKHLLQNTPNSSLIFVRSAAAKMSGTVTAKNVFNPTKLEDMSINDEMFMKISSVYKKLMFIDKPVLNREKSPARNNLYTLKRHATNAQEYAIKKTSLENQLENKKIVQITKEILEKKTANETKISKKSDNEMSITNSGKNCTWYMHETSEIAKILSDYNRSMLRKSAIQNQIYGSRSMKTNLMNSNIKNLPKNIWQKNITAEENQNLVTDANMGFDFSQRRLRQFHSTLEKIKDNQVVDCNQNAWSSSSTSFENHQIPLRNLQISRSNMKEKFIKSHKNSNKSRIIMTNTRLKEAKLKYSTDKMEISKMESLEDLLEDTAILYCAANGIHQDDLSNYIDTLDSKQSIQWLES